MTTPTEPQTDLARISLSLEEIKVLKDLLNVELYLQIRSSIVYNPTLDKQTLSILKSFDNYRIFEDKLWSLQQAILGFGREITELTLELPYLEIYRNLCISTVQDGGEYTKTERFNSIVPGILAKINVVLGPPNEGKETVSISPQKIEDEGTPLVVNIFNLDKCKN